MTKSLKTPKAAPTSKRPQPPLDKQFRPGQSGNPAGRPKGSLNKVTRGRFARMLLEEAERAAPGRPAVSMHRAMIQAVYDKAGMGELGAAALILRLTAEAEAVVAELDEAAEAREVEAAAAVRRRAADAEEEALSARLAAEEPELYRHVRELMKGKWGAPSTRLFRDAVSQARMRIALGQHPGADFDRHLAAADLKRAEDEQDEEEDA